MEKEVEKCFQKMSVLESIDSSGKMLPSGQKIGKVTKQIINTDSIKINRPGHDLRM